MIPTKDSSAYTGSGNQIHHLRNASAIDGMDGHDFERFCADLLIKVGFSEATVTPGSGDQGVDILAIKDGIKYAIQCKNYASALGNTPVQEVSAGKQFYGCHVGVVMTNSTFTSGAIQLASATNVLLWDREKLDELITKAGGLESLGIHQDYADFDSDEEPEEFLDEVLEERFRTNGYSVADDSSNDDTTHSISPRKGLKIGSKICLGWSVICFVFFIVGLFSSSLDMITIGLGEGLFVLILGLMFNSLTRTEKGNPYMTLFGKSIKKWVFITLCIVIAYALFMGILMAFGVIEVTTI